jgi:MoxR-like ATPase
VEVFSMGNRDDNEQAIKKGIAAFGKLKSNVLAVANNYFIDTEELEIRDGSNTSIEAWKLASLAIAYALNKNVLLMGEPGWGKTTASSLVASICSGLPMDLYRGALIHGHPDQSEEKMTGRPDFGRLMANEEKVVWQKSLYLPVIILDEFNRLPQGKQSELLDQIDTSRFSYLNSNFYDGKKSFFATANYDDGGNHKIIPPNKDRFAVSLEFNCPEAIYLELVAEFSNNAARDLCLPELTKTILDLVAEKSTSVPEKLGRIEEHTRESIKQLKEQIRKNCAAGRRAQANLEFLADIDYQAMRDAVAALPYDDYVLEDGGSQASVFMKALVAEFNFTPSFGNKRSCDPKDNSEHAQGLASSKVSNILSKRCISDSIGDYAKAVALYTGQKMVTKAHIEAVAPYCISHRLNLDQDFEASLQEKTRDERLEQHAARELMDMISSNFSKVENDYRILEQFIKLAREYGENGQNTKAAARSALDDPRFRADLRERLAELAGCAGTQAMDHPLLEQTCAYLNKVYSLNEVISDGRKKASR